MKNLIHAELLKLRTTRMIYGLALAAVALAPISVVGAITSAGRSGGGPALGSGEGIRNVMSSASAGGVVLLIIGIMIMAMEFRHSTVTSTFLVTPKRGKVVTAKIVAAGIVGTGVAVISAGLTLAISVPWLASKHVHVDILSHNTGVVLLGGIAAMMIYAAVGVGLGSLIRNQTAAVGVALAWVLVVEALLVGFVPEVGKWIPGGAAAALTGATNRAALPMWAGALLFAGYGLVFAVAGTRFTMRRDVS
jgi:ABC-2 type transport system permease protein